MQIADRQPQSFNLESRSTHGKSKTNKQIADPRGTQYLRPFACSIISTNLGSASGEYDTEVGTGGIHRSTLIRANCIAEQILHVHVCLTSRYGHRQMILAARRLTCVCVVEALNCRDDAYKTYRGRRLEIHRFSLKSHTDPAQTVSRKCMQDHGISEWPIANITFSDLLN
jgi:hypothetical protein